MKIIIIIVHLVLGFALIWNGVFPLIEIKNNFSDSMANTAFPTEQIYVEKCMVAGGNPTPEECRAEYNDIEKDNEQIRQARKEETGYVKENLFSIITPFILMILAGIISVISAIGFWKFRKWSAIGLVISSFAALAISLYFLGFGEFPFLLPPIPLAIIILIVVEGLYIKKGWKADLNQGIV